MLNSNSELKPFVIRKFAQSKNYDPINWSLDDLPKWLKNDFIDVRVASSKHEKSKIIFEKMCFTINLRAKNFVNWLKGEYIISNKDTTILPSTHWAYYDYRSAVNEFTQDFNDALSFDKLGIEGKFNDETVWIGSPGAYTPCHYDSYGYNLHLQLKGIKRWILFPPETKLSPARVPYEESTIYSSLDIIGGEFPSCGFQEAYCVYLNEGDLLFIPPKWWHSVQCFKGDETSGGVFSINKWFPLKSDEIERKKECLIGCLFNMVNSSTTDYEDPCEMISNLDQCISEAFHSQQSCNEPVIKKAGHVSSIEFGETQMFNFYNQHLQSAEKILPMSFTQLKEEIVSKPFIKFQRNKNNNSNEKNNKGDEATTTILNPEYVELPFTKIIREVLNAFTHESTIQHVLKLMEAASGN